MMPALASPTYWMATTLAPVDSREVLRCDRCSLVQFRTMSNMCRKCRTSLDEEPEPIPVPVIVNERAAAMSGGHNGGHLQVALAIRTLRHRNGLSQRQLAMRMKVPRTYVSKIENEKATPTLSSLQRLADALEVSVPELINGGCSREHEIRDLMADEFIAEIVPFVSKLNGLQWSNVLNTVRDLTTKPRRMT